MLQGRKHVDGLTVLDAAHLIPFKMYAWLDLTERKSKGEHVNDRDLRKHRLDVYRLLQIVPRDTKIDCMGRIRGDVEHFLATAGMTDQALSAVGISESADSEDRLLHDIFCQE